MYNVFIINVGLHPGAAEVPIVSMLLSGCTGGQPYKELNCNQANSRIIICDVCLR